MRRRDGETEVQKDLDIQESPRLALSSSQRLSVSSSLRLAISPVWFVVFAVLLWSLGGLLIKWTTLDAFTVNAGRSFFAAITVAIFTYRKGLKLDKFTLLTSFLYAGTLSCFVYANKNTTAANAIFLQ